MANPTAHAAVEDLGIDMLSPLYNADPEILEADSIQREDYIEEEDIDLEDKLHVLYVVLTKTKQRTAAASATRDCSVQIRTLSTPRRAAIHSTRSACSGHSRFVMTRVVRTAGGA